MMDHPTLGRPTDWEYLAEGGAHVVYRRRHPFSIDHGADPQTPKASSNPIIERNLNDKVERDDDAATAAAVKFVLRIKKRWLDLASGRGQQQEVFATTSGPSPAAKSKSYSSATITTTRSPSSVVWHSSLLPRLIPTELLPDRRELEVSLQWLKGLEGYRRDKPIENSKESLGPGSGSRAGADETRAGSEAGKRVKHRGESSHNDGGYQQTLVSSMTHDDDNPSSTLEDTATGHDQLTTIHVIHVELLEDLLLSSSSSSTAASSSSSSSSLVSSLPTASGAADTTSELPSSRARDMQQGNTIAADRKLCIEFKPKWGLLAAPGLRHHHQRRRRQEDDRDETLSAATESPMPSESFLISTGSMDAHRRMRISDVKPRHCRFCLHRQLKKQEKRDNDKRPAESQDGNTIIDGDEGDLVDNGESLEGQGEAERKGAASSSWPLSVTYCPLDLYACVNHHGGVDVKSQGPESDVGGTPARHNPKPNAGLSSDASDNHWSHEPLPSSSSSSSRALRVLQACRALLSIWQETSGKAASLRMYLDGQPIQPSTISEQLFSITKAEGTMEAVPVQEAIAHSLASWLALSARGLLVLKTLRELQAAFDPWDIESLECWVRQAASASDGGDAEAIIEELSVEPTAEELQGLLGGDQAATTSSRVANIPCPPNPERPTRKELRIVALGIATAAIFKDCSIIVQIPLSDLGKTHERITARGGSEALVAPAADYHVKLIDLDLKPMRKLAGWMALDREIRENYNELSEDALCQE